MKQFLISAFIIPGYYSINQNDEIVKQILLQKTGNILFKFIYEKLSNIL